MTVFQAFSLGLAQGIGEFLPISSSAHLILIPWLLKWPDPGLTFDVALHIGTLFAVIAYFWKDWLTLFQHGLGVQNPGRQIILVFSHRINPGGHYRSVA